MSLFVEKNLNYNKISSLFISSRNVSMVQYPTYYYGARVAAFILDFALAWAILLGGTLLWNFRSLLGSWNEVVRIEAEAMQNSGFQPSKYGWASGDTLMQTVSEGTLSGKVPKSGIFDIVICYRDQRLQKGSRLELRVGEHTRTFRYDLVKGGFMRELIFKGIELKAGQQIFIQGYAGEAEFVGFDYLDLIPSESLAFRPRGVEPAYQHGDLFRAFDYDDRNVHLSLIKVPFIFSLLQLFWLSFTKYTPGLYLMGLRATGAFGWRSALLRQFGLLFSILSCGLGSLWSLSSRFKQSWSDIAGSTFIVTKEMDHPGIFSHSYDHNIFLRATHSVGSFATVPLGHRIVGCLIDIFLTALLCLAGIFVARYHLFKDIYVTPSRYELEDFDLQGFKHLPSIRRSNSRSIIPVKEQESSLATTEFTGPPGDYDVRLAFADIKAGSKVDVSIGLMTHSITSIGKDYRRVPIFKHVRIARNDTIRIEMRAQKQGGTTVLLDYIEFLPSFEEPTYLVEDSVSPLTEPLVALGITNSTFHEFIVLLLVLHSLAYSILLGYFSETPGTHLLGFSLVDHRRETVGPVRVLFRLALYFAAPFWSLLSLFFPIPRNLVNRISRSSFEFNDPPTSVLAALEN